VGRRPFVSCHLGPPCQTRGKAQLYGSLTVSCRAHRHSSPPWSCRSTAATDQRTITKNESITYKSRIYQNPSKKSPKIIKTISHTNPLAPTGATTSNGWWQSALLPRWWRGVTSVEVGSSLAVENGATPSDARCGWHSDQCGIRPIADTVVVEAADRLAWHTCARAWAVGHRRCPQELQCQPPHCHREGGREKMNWG
jgi:hypothetical protein